jgi:hypothetical protein
MEKTPGFGLPSGLSFPEAGGVAHYLLQVFKEPFAGFRGSTPEARSQRAIPGLPVHRRKKGLADVWQGRCSAESNGVPNRI